MIFFLHFNGLSAEYYHTLCSAYVLSARRGWETEYIRFIGLHFETDNNGSPLLQIPQNFWVKI